MSQKPKAVVMWAGASVRRWNNKSIALIAGVVSALVLVAIAAWLWWPNKSQPEAVPALSKAEQTEAGDDIADAYRNGDPQLAQAEIDKQLANPAITPEQRAGFLELKAGWLVREAKADEALALYKESENLQRGKRYLSIPTAQGLMLLYSDKGDNKTAAAYGRKMIESVKASKDPFLMKNLSQNEAVVRELESKAL